jgi:hypothetical protein
MVRSRAAVVRGLEAIVCFRLSGTRETDHLLPVIAATPRGPSALKIFPLYIETDLYWPCRWRPPSEPLRSRLPNLGARETSNHPKHRPAHATNSRP